MNIILLSGGSGTRLWPLSNDIRAKQFLKIFCDDKGNSESMLQKMYRNIKAINPNNRILIAALEEQSSIIQSQLSDYVEISVEPCRRDTFPAIALAAAYLHDINGIDENETVVVCPIDPLVDTGYYHMLEEMSLSAINENLVLMGIKPTAPSSKYGYILGKSFKEKPSEFEASNLIDQGALWNAGVFAFKLSYILEKASCLLGSSSYKYLFQHYANLPKISFDYAVVEHEPDFITLEYDGTWADLGTWDSLSNAMNGVNIGSAKAVNCHNTQIINELSIPVLSIGIDNAVIVSTQDGILVTDKIMSPQLKEYAVEVALRPMYEEKKWGYYKILDYHTNGSGQQIITKELVINSRKSISYQVHLYRSEVWTIIDGFGYVVIDGSIVKVEQGICISIQPMKKHSVYAVEEMRIIETQFGSHLSEQDIIRYDWDWNKQFNS